jgi:hypothetical protein
VCRRRARGGLLQRGKARAPSGITIATSPSIFASLVFSVCAASAMDREDVRPVLAVAADEDARPSFDHAADAVPSYLISWSQRSPLGGSLPSVRELRVDTRCGPFGPISCMFDWSIFDLVMRC